MNQMKKILAFLLLGSILLLTSCAGEKSPLIETQELGTPVQSETKESENEYAIFLEDLPNEDFGGEPFRIATDSSSLFLSSNSTSILGKELYLRNLAIEEKYNVKITLTDESGTGSIADRVRIEAMAGNDFCDLVVLESASFASLAGADLLQNVRSIPYLDLQGSGIDPSSLESTTFGSKTYGFGADFSFQSSRLFAVFFNQTMLSETALPNLYDLVSANQWDLENFLIYAEEVYSVYKANGNPVTGFCSTEPKEDLVNIFWAASGNRFFSNEFGERPSLIYDTEETESFIKQLQTILFGTTVYAQEEQTSMLKFKNGSSLFLIAPLSSAEELVACGVDWGVVPLPKLDINQKNYYTYAKNAPLYAGFANGSGNLKKSGMVTNAFVTASEAFWQELSITTHLNLYANSSRDAEMLELIFGEPYYEAAEFFAGFDDSIKASTQTLLYRAISMDGRFDSLYTQYNKMLNKYLDEKF